MRRFLVQARLWGLAIKKTKVIEVRRRIEEFEIQTTRERLKAKAIILCAGSVFKKLGIPGENRLMGRGIYRVAFDEAFRFKGKKVAVVGGGDAAAHQALLLSRYAARVYLIYRGRNLKAHGLLQRRLKIAPKITALSQVVIESAEGNGALNGVHLKNLKTGSKSFLGIRALFILIGKAPNRGLLRAVKARQGAFLAGDACQGRFRQVAIASGDGMKAAMKCTQYLESVETSYGNC